MRHVNYPNNIKKDFHKKVNYANRGMDLENIINITNEYYLDHNMALIYKKPTPIGVVHVTYENNHQIIDKAYFASPSTLDYNGLYKGHYIEFDAKNTESKTSFPIANIHPHQIKHIRNVINHGGIVFLIIRINGLIYLFNGPDLINFIDNTKRKSIPYAYIKEYGYLLEHNYLKGLNYLQYVNLLLEEKNEKN